MTDRKLISSAQLIIVIAAFLLLCAGLQSACGSLIQGNQAYNPEIRVDSCHHVAVQKIATHCCQSEACHQTVPQQRDLGGPEFHNLHDISYPLVHEVRPLTPQLKVGAAFTIQHRDQPQISAVLYTPQRPLQALHNLRTIVLLN